MTKFQTGTIFTSQVMDFQLHAIGKAIRPLFADPVTVIMMIMIIGSADDKIKLVSDSYSEVPFCLLVYI